MWRLLTGYRRPDPPNITFVEDTTLSTQVVITSNTTDPTTCIHINIIRPNLYLYNIYIPRKFRKRCGGRIREKIENQEKREKIDFREFTQLRYYLRTFIFHLLS
jgi:hypothetical protein